MVDLVGDSVGAARCDRRGTGARLRVPRSSWPASPSTWDIPWCCGGPPGFDGYQSRCIDQSGGCCDVESKRYGVRNGSSNEPGGAEARGLAVRPALRRLRQLALLFQVDAQPPRAPRRSGCGLSVHFMVDADGTIYQTLDLLERAYHAEEVNSDSIGVEICNRGRVDCSEWPSPAEYRTRAPSTSSSMANTTWPTIPPRAVRIDRGAGPRAAARFPGHQAGDPRRRQPIMDTLPTPWISPGSWATFTSSARNGSGGAGLSSHPARPERVQLPGPDPLLHRAAANASRSAAAATGGFFNAESGPRVFPHRLRRGCGIRASISGRRVDARCPRPPAATSCRPARPRPGRRRRRSC